jgi:hypothetical protein
MCENQSQEPLEKLKSHVSQLNVISQHIQSVMRGGAFSDVAVVRVEFLFFIIQVSFPLLLKWKRLLELTGTMKQVWINEIQCGTMDNFTFHVPIGTWI